MTEAAPRFRQQEFAFVDLAEVRDKLERMSPENGLRYMVQQGLITVTQYRDFLPEKDIAWLLQRIDQAIEGKYSTVSEAIRIETMRGRLLVELAMTRIGRPSEASLAATWKQ